MMFMAMTLEVTWSGTTPSLLGSWSGGCPEPQGVRLPDCPHLMSQHEEQVSMGSSVL